MGCFWWIVVQKAKPKMTSYKVVREVFIRNMSTAKYLKVAWLFRKSCCWLACKHWENICICSTWIIKKKKKEWHTFHLSILFFYHFPSNSLYSLCHIAVDTMWHAIQHALRFPRTVSENHLESSKWIRLHFNGCTIYTYRSAWTQSYSWVSLQGSNLSPWHT